MLFLDITVLNTCVKNKSDMKNHYCGSRSNKISRGLLLYNLEIWCQNVETEEDAASILDQKQTWNNVISLKTQLKIYHKLHMVILFELNQHY